MPKILDCTLRDGGYINNWNFPLKNAKNIIKLLQKAKIDFIEIGFYHHNLAQIIPDDCSNILAMVQFSKTPIENIPSVDNSKIKGLRIIFKKHENREALEYCKKIKDKGYNFFINATFTSQYENNELIDLIKKVNKIKPYCITITDSMGTFTSYDIKRIYEIVQNELDDEIAMCFHSHNNLGLSYSNAKTLIELNQKRELIIDATAFGMGRGAGNLNCELLIKYLNEKGKNYKLEPVLKIIDKYILPIYKKNPWGYSIPYYLSAIHKCHPNYAKFLIEKNADLNRMDKIFSSIPNNKKTVYDEELVSQKFVQSAIGTCFS